MDARRRWRVRQILGESLLRELGRGLRRRRLTVYGRRVRVALSCPTEGLPQDSTSCRGANEAKVGPVFTRLVQQFLGILVDLALFGFTDVKN